MLRTCYAYRGLRSSKVTLPTIPPRSGPNSKSHLQWANTSDGFQHMMRTEEHRPVLLSEYRPPDWLVETVNLDVKLDPTQTPVRATLKLKPNPDAQAPAPLVFDG